MNFAEFLLEYKGEHSAPTKDEASLDDLTKNGVYPDDVYTHPKYYVNDNTDQECYNIAIACKGQPNKSVRIYRAVPLGDKKWTEKELAKAEKTNLIFESVVKHQVIILGSKMNSMVISLIKSKN